MAPSNKQEILKAATKLGAAQKEALTVGGSTGNVFASLGIEDGETQEDEQFPQLQQPPFDIPASGS